MDKIEKIVIPEKKWGGAHLKRIVTAAFGLPILIIFIIYTTPFYFWLLLAGCILLGLMEFYHLLTKNTTDCLTLTGLGLGLLVSITFFKGSIASVPSSLVISLVVILPFFISLTQAQDFSIVILKLFGTIVGVFYVAWLLSHLLLIRVLPHGKNMIFFLLLVVWTGDTAAFYTGKIFGKHKLSPRISPKKTIEGALGGIFGSIIVSAIAHFSFLKQINLANSIFLGFLLNVFGQLGDLTESLLKRGFRVKDSGTLIPGHGGILDRIDSILFAGPALYYYVILYLHR